MTCLIRIVQVVDRKVATFAVLLSSFATVYLLYSRSAIDLKKQPQPYSDNQVGYKEWETEVHPWCRHWAVVASVDSEWASEAVRRQVRMHNWCLVIVFDKTPSESYDTRWFEGEGNKAVVILTPNNLAELGDCEFVKSCKWDYIGRKNIGYYYAIAHGADTIWDFDDDNMLKFWISGAAPLGAPSIGTLLPQGKKVKVLEPRGHKWPTWNPYPVMGAPVLPSWPRGLPIDDAVNENCSNVDLKQSEVPGETIAVLQSLSDRQPDADALYQARMPLPFYFSKREMKSVLVPTFSMTPYNTHATLHFDVGFWALYLPNSMESDLSDIWRSYIAQRLFWETGLRVGFIGRPLVVQDRNIHSSLQDISKVKYTSGKIKRLITFLGSWKSKEKLFFNQIKELWLSLHQNGLISSEDLRMVNLWLQSLLSIRYNFPEIVNISSFNYHYPINSPQDIKSTFSSLLPNITEKERYTVVRNGPEYDKTQCQDPKESLTFWTSDIHIASRRDHPSFLGTLGNKVLIAIGQRYKWNEYVWKMKGIQLYDRVSDVIKKNFWRVEAMDNRLTEEMVIENFEFYKNDTEIASVDAFVCCFQPGMCEMWMPFNKTIVMIPAHRYNMGRCTLEEFEQLNEHLRTLASMDHPKHVIASGSKYDLEYLRHYTGLEVLPLYSYTTYVANYTYSPSREEIALFVRTRWPYNNSNKRFATDIKKVKVKEVAKLYEHYAYSDLVKHRGIVFVPYAVMTYKMTELYTMGIPLFFPSMKYFHNIKAFGPDRSILDMPWCERANGTLNDTQMVPHPSSIHPYSPNALDKESEFYWLQLADFVQWPHITYFDDFKDLEHKLLKADFNKIHKLMVAENKRRKKELENNWCKVFKKIKKGQEVPHDYKTAIKDLYGTSRLQVY